MGVPGQKLPRERSANLPACRGCVSGMGTGMLQPHGSSPEHTARHSPTVGTDPAQSRRARDSGLCHRLKGSTRLCSAAAPGAGWGRGPVIYRGDMCFT